MYINLQDSNMNMILQTIHTLIRVLHGNILVRAPSIARVSQGHPYRDAVSSTKGRIRGAPHPNNGMKISPSGLTTRMS